MSRHSGLTLVILSLGPRLIGNATDILGTISRTLITYPLRSYVQALFPLFARLILMLFLHRPMRPTLSTAYSIILTALGAAIDPEEGKKSLARVWRSVLEDIGSIAVEPVATVSSDVCASLHWLLTRCLTARSK